MINVAIVITCFNHAQYTKRAIESLQKTTRDSEKYEFTFAVFDDASTDNTPAVVQQLGGDYVIYWRSLQNNGLTYLWNEAYRRFIDRDYIVIVNNDVVFTPNWCTRILDTMEKRNCQMAGPITNGPGHIGTQDVRRFISDFEPSDTWEDLSLIPEKLKNEKPFEVRRINGFCIAFRTEFLHLAQKGRNGEPFDPKNRNFGNEDEIQDRLNPRPLVIPSSFVFHYKRVTIRNRYRKFFQYRPK